LDHSELPLISLIFTAPHLSKVPRKLLQLKKEADLFFRTELLVVFSQKTNSCEALATQFPEVSFFSAPIEGPGQARQFGLTCAKGKARFLFDADCLPDFESIRRVLEVLKQEPRVLWGGNYFLQSPASYWAKTYHQTQQIWLEFGKKEEGRTEHLLGGCLFMTDQVAQKIQFRMDLSWGGEEKVMIQQLWSDHQIPAKLHSHFRVLHEDSSGFRKFFKRAFHQGKAAGLYRLESANRLRGFSNPDFCLLPGLCLFFLVSRTGFFWGLHLRRRFFSKGLYGQ
jgi:hypothetical protein